MICDPLQIIFLHCPKTGGQSITATLREAAVRATEPRPYTWRRWEQHWRAHQYRHYHPDKWESYMRFGVCRNPFGRLLSFHRYNRQRLKVTGSLPEDAPVVDPGHFLKHLKNLGANDLFSFPNCRFLGKDPDFVLRWERLGVDWAHMVAAERLEERFGISPQLRVQNHAPYRLDVAGFYRENPEIAEMILSLYSQDFDVFGYSEDPEECVEEQPEPATVVPADPNIRRKLCC